jgi:hypothetical protein
MSDGVSASFINAVRAYRHAIGRGVAISPCCEIMHDVGMAGVFHGLKPMRRSRKPQ